MAEFNDWKKLEQLDSNLIKDFVNAFDIVFHKDEEDLRQLFDNPSMEKTDIDNRVRKLNTLYHTRLWDEHIKSIVKFLSDEGEDFEKKILSGDIEVVEQIARCGGKNWFVFATKYSSFVNKDDKYPIFDHLVAKSLSYFLDIRTQEFENIRQECDYARYKEIVKGFRDQYSLGFKYKDIDKFLWLVGKNLKDDKRG